MNKFYEYSRLDHEAIGDEAMFLASFNTISLNTVHESIFASSLMRF